MKKVPALVLGAGPAGLAFAQAFGPGCTILERDTEVGGLSRSLQIGDGVFDLGGHSFHSPYTEVHDLVTKLMGDNWFQQTRDARVQFGSALIPYPFQQHFGNLPDRTVVGECEGHRADPEDVASSQNFEEWIYRQFGEGVARHFMLPYNRKLWAHDLKDLACDWVGQRVATTSQPSNEAHAQPQRRPLQADSQVAYPRQGGFGSIFKAMAQQCQDIKLGQVVVTIDPDLKQVMTASGEIWRYDRLVSTIPLPALLRCMTHCSADILAQAAALKAVSLKIVMLLASLGHREVPQRVYVADPAFPPHKIAFNHTSSPDLARRDHHAIMAEVSYSAHKAIGSDEDLVSSMIEWLKILRFIERKEDVVTQHVVDIPLGYPINDHRKSEIISNIRNYLIRFDIHIIGRFGSWEYANSDKCIYDGMRLSRAFK